MKRFLRYVIGAALLVALFWWVARGSAEPRIADGSLLVIVPVSDAQPTLRIPELVAGGQQDIS